jgi:hypothetical protein
MSPVRVMICRVRIWLANRLLDVTELLAPQAQRERLRRIYR